METEIRNISRLSKLQENIAKRGKERLLVQWPTGMGKSRVALLRVEEDQPTLIVVPQISDIAQWKSKFRKWDMDSQLEHTEIICYASIHKYGDFSGHLVLDEYHHTTERAIEYIKKMKLDKITALSATGTFESRERLLSIEGQWYSSKISLEEAIEDNFVPPSAIYVHHIELHDEEPTETYEYDLRKYKKSKKKTVQIDYNQTKEFKKRMMKNPYQNYVAIVKCTPVEKYRLIQEQIETQKRKLYEGMLSKKDRKWEKRFLNRLGLKRKNFLAQYKTDKAVEILEQLERFIAFAHRIEQAKEIGERLGLGHTVIHSKRTNSENEKVIENFEKKESNSIIAVGKLREGADLNDPQSGLAIQLDRKNLSFVQMVGRIMRSEMPSFHVIVVDGTVDEDLLDNALDSNKKVIHV